MQVDILHAELVYVSMQVSNDSTSVTRAGCVHNGKALTDDTDQQTTSRELVHGCPSVIQCYAVESLEGGLQEPMYHQTAAQCKFGWF